MCVIFFLKEIIWFLFLNLNKKNTIFDFFFLWYFFMNNSFLYAYLVYQNASLVFSDVYSGDQKLSGLFDITTFSPMGPVESDHFSRLATWHTSTHDCKNCNNYLPTQSRSILLFFLNLWLLTKFELFSFSIVIIFIF